MKILHLIDSLYRGGAQKVVIDTVKLFPEHTHVIGTFEKFSGLEDEIQDLANVNVVNLPFKNIFSIFKSYRFVRKLVLDLKIDIVHSHMFVPNLLARALSGNIRKYSTYHGEVFEFPSYKKKIIIFLEKISFNRSTLNIFVSEHVKRYVLRHLNKRDGGKVIYNFVAESPYIKTYSSIVGRDIRIVATSNNQPYKNYLLILKVLAELKEQPIHLYIYGDLMDNLKEFVSENQIQHKVTFLGVHNNIQSVLPKYDGFIMASDSGEGFSLALLEAMYAGLGVICSDIPQFVEAVGTGRQLVFQNRSHKDLKRVMQAIIKDPGILEEEGKLMKARANMFSKERFYKEMHSLYQ